MCDDALEWGFFNESPLQKQFQTGIEWSFFDRFFIRSLEKNEEPSDFIRWKDRPTYRFHEKSYNSPQAIFMCQIGGKLFWGRKILSEHYRNNRLTAFFCSRITESMIIGAVKSSKQNGTDISISYYPLHQSERHFIFEQLKCDPTIEITFPFRRTDFKTGEEYVSKNRKWKNYENLDNYLALGEAHIRQFTKSYLASNDILSPNSSATVYDPACSTGFFLRDLQDCFPTITTIGGDISEEMVEMAKDRVNIVYLEDAAQSSVPYQSVDIIFLRFLNYYVITSSEAKLHFQNIVERVKPGGYVVVFGHTPVLITRDEMCQYGFTCCCSTGYDTDSNSIFQYYVLQRNGGIENV